MTGGQTGKGRVRGCALASVSILFLVVMSAVAKAQPSGGSVVAGQAQISASGATTLINQSTPTPPTDVSDLSSFGNSSLWQ
jgi:hypothetical protein